MITDYSLGAERFFQIHLGGDRNFCYLLGDGDSGEAAAIDPGFDPERFAAIAQEQGLRLKYILITHGHSDHMGGAAQLQALTGASLHAGAADQVPGAEPVRDGQAFLLGQRPIEAVATPGHSPGHMCYLYGDRLLTGDLLFCGKIGGTGPFFPGSSAEDEYASLTRILELDDEVSVFPGHDYYGGEGEMRHSTIGYERAHNPFLTVPDFDAFCHLKETWAEYKKVHGIK